MKNIKTIILIVVIIFMAYTRECIAKEYTYKDSYFSLSLRETWTEATKEELSEVNKTLTEMAQWARVYPIIKAFKPINPTDSGLPYILVEEHKAGSSGYKFYKKMLDDGLDMSSDNWMGKLYDNKFIQENIKNLSINSPLISKKDWVILMSFWLDISGQSQKGFLAVFVWSKNVLLFKFYTDATNYKKDILIFQEIIRSFKFSNATVIQNESTDIAPSNSSLDKVELDKINNDNFAIYPIKKKDDSIQIWFYLLFGIITAWVWILVQKKFKLIK